MTKEEINKKIEEERKWLMCAGFNAYNVDIVLDTIKQEIKGITLEPCEDAVSREAVLEYQQYLHGKMSNEENHKLWEFIKDLPSVTPELSSLREMNDALKKRVEFLENMIRYASVPARKKGKWICVHHIENKIAYDSWKCSECQHDFDSEEESMVYFNEYKHCPKCGAEMEVEK